MWGRLHSLVLFWGVALFLFASQSLARDDGLRGGRLIDGTLTPTGELLLAGPGGATLALEQGARLRAEAGTLLRFDKFMKLHLGSGPDPMVLTRVVSVEAGSVTTTIPADRRFAVLMQAPRKLRAILSEGRAMLIASEERSSVAAVEGTVLVTLADKWRPLRAGNIQIVSRAYPMGLRRAVLGAPRQPVLSRSLLIEGAGEDSTTLMSWPPVAGAVQYEVELTREAASEQPLRQRTREARFSIGPVSAGTYRVVVSPVDDSGLPGGVSPAVTLNVVGLDVPKTASRGRNGAVRLQPGQRVGLLGAEGLEVGYLGFEEFLPAPKSLGLVARRPITTLLRHPTSGETARLELEPMTVRAQIEFEKHPHSWPQRGLPINVQLVDDQGYAVTEDFRASCRVTVNVQPTEPVWQREGSTLQTLLERPSGPGPWMVRVEVLDENGVSIGMDFSEVAYEPAPTAANKARR